MTLMTSNSRLERIALVLQFFFLLLITMAIAVISGCGSEDNQNLTGQVTAGGAGLSGVQISMSGVASPAATTDANGNYTFSNVTSGTVTLTPSKAGFVFSPPNRTFILLGVDLAGLSFSAYVSGRLSTSEHSIFLKSDGSVWTWGKNSNGQLGDGTTTDESSPLPVDLTNIIPVGSTIKITAVAAGSSHTVVLANNGTVWAWGKNSNGQLGDGTVIDRPAPVRVSGLTGVTAIAAGANHTIALKSDNTVWAWGSNSNGQLGDGTIVDKATPVQVAGLNNIIAAVAAGETHSLALININPQRNDGTVWAWGHNDKGQLGDGSLTDRLTAVQVAGLTGISAIAAGFKHNIALRNIFTATNDGTLLTWGSNGNGQLGDGTTVDKLIPVQVAGLSIMTMIAAGFDHTIALRNDGIVWAWGHNDKGQLGDGTAIDKLSPIPVTGLTGVMAIAAGSRDNVVLKNDGTTLQAWGMNTNGQLGDGTVIDKLNPVTVLMP
jgi:alpha-tubulin suppressor-like RCC1 family protein